MLEAAFTEHARELTVVRRVSQNVCSWLEPHLLTPRGNNGTRTGCAANHGALRRAALATDNCANDRSGTGTYSYLRCVLALRRFSFLHDGFRPQRHPLVVMTQTRKAERHARSSLHASGTLGLGHVASDLGSSW